MLFRGKTKAEIAIEAEKLSAERYRNRDCGLMEAIADSYPAAVEGLIKYYQHNVNSYVIQPKYMLTPTPLSYALSQPEINMHIVEKLIALGADKNDRFAVELAAKSSSSKIRDLFKDQIEQAQQPSTRQGYGS